jgi:hypothetical protein
MKKTTKLIGSTVTAVMAMSLAVPSYAHWGPTSAAATYGNDKYCNHADAGNTNVRRARVRLELHADWISFEGGGYYMYWDMVQLRNVSGNGGRIDVVGLYYSPFLDPFDWSVIGQFNDVNDGSTRRYGGWWESTSGQPGVTNAKCFVTNG